MLYPRKVEKQRQINPTRRFKYFFYFLNFYQLKYNWIGLSASAVVDRTARYFICFCYFSFFILTFFFWKSSCIIHYNILRTEESRSVNGAEEWRLKEDNGWRLGESIENGAKFKGGSPLTPKCPLFTKLTYYW